MRVSTAISAPFIVHSSPLLGQIDEPEDDIYDLFASYGNGRVYKNGSRTTFGLIIGTLIHDLYAVSQSITTAHIQHENSQLLVPSKSLCGKTVEGHQNIISCPISFKESSITKTHLLALFTPPSCMKDSQKILTTVQFVLGQLDEVFDLQRFIELVEQEKWDEEAATFIAFRQTILTMLVSSPDDDDLRERFSTYRTIVMELDDPVLLSAGLVPVLMDMAVHEFLSVETATRKLIGEHLVDHVDRNTLN
ncbi:hypothetical protein FRC18_005727 [Serendipita sp. 400]|nr:hypothetical protein FRC18_005727 [Serendipita sp. 400]